MPDMATATANTAVGGALTEGTTYYASLHTADPGATGANELTGGSYERQPITFGAASGGVMSATNTQSFSGMPAVAGDLYVGLWTTQTDGDYLWGDPNAATTTAILAGATLVIGAVTAQVS